MSRPMSSRISPPAISNAGNVMPNMRKMNWPAMAKLVSTMKQVIAPLRAIRLRRAASALSVMARKDGMAAKGSTRKKMELSASSEKRTMGAWLSSLIASAAELEKSTLQAIAKPELVYREAEIAKLH